MTLFEVISSNSIIAGTISSLIAGAILWLIRRRYRQKRAARQWYGEATGLLSNHSQASKTATRYRDGVNTRALPDLFDDLDREIMRHANEAPKRVSHSAKLELAMIGAFTTALTSLTEKSTETDTLEFLKTVQNDAIQNFDGDYTMDDLEALSSSFDFDEFAQQIDRDIEVDEDVAQQLRSEFHEESLEAGHPTTIEEALNIPIETVQNAFASDEDFNLVVDDALEAMVSVMTDFAKNTHKKMEQRKERV
ncbi:hypothetical protein [Salinarchaeum chitinilyticum]